jgi:hypothetical protein
MIRTVNRSLHAVWQLFLLSWCELDGREDCEASQDGATDKDKVSRS